LVTHFHRLKKQASKPSLRALLLIPFVTLISGAVGLTGYLSFRNGQESVNAVASSLRNEINARIRERLYTYLETPHAINRINTNAVRYGTLNLDDANATASHLWQQIQAFELMSLIYVGRANGEYLGASRDGKQITVDFVSTKTDGYYYAYLPDKRGFPAQLVSSVTDRRYDPRKRPWYESTVKAQKPIWSPVYTFFNPPSLGITATNPLYDESGNLTAIFATDLSLLTISEFLRELKVGKTGQSFVIERSGTLIATSTTDKPYALNQANKPEPIAADKSTNLITKTTTQQLYQRFGDLQKINQPEQLSFKVNRDRVFVEVSPIQDTHGIDWLSVVVIPEADFMEQINTNARNTALLCLLTLGLATAAGILISRRITRLILNLSEASQAIAQGNLDRLVNVQGIRELETLGRSFNQMAAQLRESFATLEQVNKELETRVENRTAELKAANAEISLLNNKLKAENVRMSAELNVARKLQEMILPKEMELTQIAPLDIAGFMEAYDVLRNNQQIKIGIGDVTGHGLESGVLMIMTQTAVRTLQAVNEHDPVKALSALNRVIYQNAKRMNSDKNLTLALIDYQDGVLRLYGQHEEAILVRANGEVERIDTLELGFPIGLVDDIADFIAQKQIQLSPGDGVVLYTDGITEAENCQRELYGIERLITVIQRHWQHSASQIRSAIVEDVRDFIGDSKVYDDITLVVLKQK